MSTTSFDKKRHAVFAVLIVVSVLIYAISAQAQAFITAAQIIAMSALTLFCLYAGRSRIFLSATLIVIMTAVGFWVYADPLQAILFTLGFALPGLCIGIGLTKKRDFAEYMVCAVVLLVIVNIFSIYYDLTLMGAERTVDAAIDYLMAPVFNMLSQYASPAGQEASVNMASVEAVVRSTAIGSFVSAMILQVFGAYALAGALNTVVKLKRPGFFESLKLFNISRVGGIIFLVCAIVNLWTAGENPNIYAANLYAILQYPLALGGVATIYRLMSMYGAKQKTKRTVTAVVCILTIIPVLNISSIISYVGALNALVPFTMPKDVPPGSK
ncbi:MAG: DUF2232 domain-containing protein [Clostridia bacterium]|nr:DUF2232 domain-containing protein [Clostridia bacterium]